MKLSLRENTVEFKDGFIILNDKHKCNSLDFLISLKFAKRHITGEADEDTPHELVNTTVTVEQGVSNNQTVWKVEGVLFTSSEILFLADIIGKDINFVSDVIELSARHYAYVINDNLHIIVGTTKSADHFVIDVNSLVACKTVNLVQETKPQLAYAIINVEDLGNGFTLVLTTCNNHLVLRLFKGNIKSTKMIHMSKNKFIELITRLKPYATVGV